MITIMFSRNFLNFSLSSYPITPSLIFWVFSLYFAFPGRLGTESRSSSIFFCSSSLINRLSSESLFTDSSGTSTGCSFCSLAFTDALRASLNQSLQFFESPFIFTKLSRRLTTRRRANIRWLRVGQVDLNKHIFMEDEVDHWEILTRRSSHRMS